MSHQIEFHSEAIYIQSAKTLKEKIQKLDNIIDKLEAAAADSATNQGFESYSLDDGQTKINVSYRNIDDVLNSLRGFYKLREMYVNKLNGRTTRAVPGDNFRNYH